MSTQLNNFAQICLQKWGFLQRKQRRSFPECLGYDSLHAVIKIISM